MTRSINVRTEQMEPLDTAEIPGNPHRATRYRWALTGIKNAFTGERILLPTVTIGGRKWTSRESVDEFIKLLNAREIVQSANAVSPAQRQRQSTAARHELEAMGIAGGK